MSIFFVDEFRAFDSRLVTNLGLTPLYKSDSHPSREFRRETYAWVTVTLFISTHLLNLTLAQRFFERSKWEPS
jgi:hypothetical protein